MELSIDTAAAQAGVALTDQGELVACLAWRTRGGAAAELLPAIEVLLRQAGVERQAITALFVCHGPGSYGGLRVGISTAMGLALTLEAGLLAVGRLEADAFVHAAYPGPIMPLHAAGRGDLAWAAYRSDGHWQELSPPRLAPEEAIAQLAPPNALLCGEVSDELAAGLRAARPDLTIVTGAAHHRRAVTLAALAWPRYQSGSRSDRLALEPIYLREPNITVSRAERAARLARAVDGVPEVQL